MSGALVLGFASAPPTNAVSGPISTPNSNTLSNLESEKNVNLYDHFERQAIKSAQTFLTQNANAWGVDASQFKPSSVVDGTDSMSVVRFSQSVNGIEVANSLLAITVNQDGNLLSYSNTTSNYSGASETSISQSEATKLLKAKLAKKYGTQSDQVNISEISLVIVDSELVDDVPVGQYLAWRAITMIYGDTASISMTYLHQDGSKILSTLPFIRGITTAPFVCDLQVDPSISGYVLPPGVVADSDEIRYIDISSSLQKFPLCGIDTSGRDAKSTKVARKNVERTWKYFYSVLEQDITAEKYLGNVAPSLNGDSKPRISAFINVCATNSECPYINAFWVPWLSSDCNSGACSGIYLGRGFDAADDVVAHELAHGVSFSLAFSSALADNSETAALSEAVSDIFGEATDQLYLNSGELPDRNWSIGEDVTPGGYRNMRKPSVARIDENWSPRRSHDNSGPVNKLAYLLANGGKVGEVKIKALGTKPKTPGLCTSRKECRGIVQMSKLVFATTSNLSPSANYFDFGKEMMNSCSAFVKNKTPGFKESTCENVAAALKAQGFTKFSITGTTKLGTVNKGTRSEIRAKAKSFTGGPVRGQKMALQVKQRGKWKTVKIAKTNGSGNVSFSFVLNKSSSYRIISKTNGGVFSEVGKTMKVKVK